MPRRPRVHAPGACYHVTLRGNHRQAIFRTDADREEFAELLAEALYRFDARAHAYCWMTNHIHLLAQVGDPPLGCIIHTLASRYARRFQRSVPTTGHLFERRYHASLMSTDDHLLEAVRYIHRNPVEAGIVADPREYRWSSHGAYLGHGGPSWLTTRLVLGMFGADDVTASHAYGVFMRTLPGADAEATSADDVAEACAALRHAVSVTRRSVPSACLRRDCRASDMDRARSASLEALIATVCSRAGIPADQLASPSRSTRLSALRASIAAEALRGHVATLTEVALRFERNVASVSRLLQRHDAKRSSDAPRRPIDGAHPDGACPAHITGDGELQTKKTKAKPGTIVTIVKRPQ